MGFIYSIIFFINSIQYFYLPIFFSFLSSISLILSINLFNLRLILSDILVDLSFLVSISLYFIFQFLALSSIEYSTQYIEDSTEQEILKKARTTTFIGKKQQNEILDQHFVEKYFMGEFALFSSSLYENVTFFVDFLLARRNLQQVVKSWEVAGNR